MTRAKALAKHIERTVTGPMWHGPALAQVLEGVTAAQAAARPIPGAHTIWELVLHVTAWVDIARARLKGERIEDPSPDQDWPPAPGSDPKSGSDPVSDPAWRLAVEQLGASHRLLAADVGAVDDAALGATVKGLEYTVSVMLRGIVEHGTYHGGQISLLHRATK